MFEAESCDPASIHLFTNVLADKSLLRKPYCRRE